MGLEHRSRRAYRRSDAREKSNGGVMRRFTKDDTIEDLLDEAPAANGFLIERGLPCLVCGEPFWGTIEDLARRNGVEDVEGLVSDMNDFLEGGPGS
jgi:hypothetical protein